VRILEVLGREGLLDQGLASDLTEAYLAYRGAAHQLALQQQPGEVDAQRFAPQRERVTACWEDLFGGVAAGEETA
jgi:glutamate-ammonia-ligase adenylyltransferase